MKKQSLKQIKQNNGINILARFKKFLALYGWRWDFQNHWSRLTVRSIPSWIQDSQPASNLLNLVPLGLGKHMDCINLPVEAVSQRNVRYRPEAQASFFLTHSFSAGDSLWQIQVQKLNGGAAVSHSVHNKVILIQAKG